MSNNPQKVKEAQLVVGIPSYNEAKTIGFVVEQASLGLEKYFPDIKSVIINVDNNSPDGTKEAFLKAKSNIPLIYLSTPKGVKGKGRNFHNLFLEFKKLKAKAGVVIDADIKSIDPSWIEKLAQPILSGQDYVSPFYSRRKDDAFITNQLVYPLVYGLLGIDLRQPIGGDFAFSEKLVSHWLDQEWDEYVNQFGIDIFMTLHALFSKVKISQVNLGKKVHKSSIPSLGPMFTQVVSTLFKLINLYSDDVKKVNQVERVSVLGGEKTPSFNNSAPDCLRFEQFFKDEFSLNQEWFDQCLCQEDRDQLKKVKEKDMEIDLDLWIKSVYQFLHCFSQDNNPRKIEALRCLYFGRATAFFKGIKSLSQSQFEEEVRRQAQYFFQKRDYYFNLLNK